MLLPFFNIQRDIRYLLTGSVTKFINIFTYFLILYFVGNLLLAVFIAASFSNLYNLYGMGRLFQNNSIFSLQTITRFLLVFVLGSSIDLVLITLLVRQFIGLNSYDAKLISMILLTQFTYLLNRFWIHRGTPKRLI